jgi:hypothetical protein
MLHNAASTMLFGAAPNPLLRLEGMGRRHMMEKGVEGKKWNREGKWLQLTTFGIL